MKNQRPTRSKGLGKDRRRKHQHWRATVYYHDGEKFARVYIQRAKAEGFAARQKKSPFVKSVRITEVDKG